MTGGPPPDFEALPRALTSRLDQRLATLPVERIHRMADYFALRDVETKHIRRLAWKIHPAPDPVVSASA